MAAPPTRAQVVPLLREIVGSANVLDAEADRLVYGYDASAYRFIYFFKALNEKRVVLLLIGISFGFRLFAVLVAQGVAHGRVPYGFLVRDFLKGHFIKGLS